MIARSIDTDNDWNFGLGLGSYVSGTAHVMQDIHTRLYTFIADCFFDLTAGADWFTLLGNKDQTALNLAINSIILNTQDVTGMIQLTVNLNRQTRTFSASYIVQTSYSKNVAGAYIFDATRLG